MSYCVNCGVELAESEKYCPLCNVEVCNPQAPFDEKARRPFPPRADAIMRRADRRYMVGLAALLMLVPVAVSLLVNWFVSGEISWAVYVVSSIVLVYVFVLFPFALDKPSFELCMAADSVLTILFLYMLARMSNGDWFVPFALPVALIACASVFGVVELCTKLDIGKAAKVSIVFAAASINILAIEALLNVYKERTPVVTWSIYAAAVTVILSVFFVIVDRKRRLKEEIKKRFYV